MRAAVIDILGLENIFLLLYPLSDPHLLFTSVRKKTGKIYNIFLGAPNGYYGLALHDPDDRACLDKLISLSDTFGHERLRRDLGDTCQSQHLPWSGFRNLKLDGNAFVPDAAWFQNIPKMGFLELDFVSAGKFFFFFFPFTCACTIQTDEGISTSTLISRSEL